MHFASLLSVDGPCSSNLVCLKCYFAGLLDDDPTVCKMDCGAEHVHCVCLLYVAARCSISFNLEMKA